MWVLYPIIHIVAHICIIPYFTVHGKKNNNKGKIHFKIFIISYMMLTIRSVKATISLPLFTNDQKKNFAFKKKILLFRCNALINSLCAIIPIFFTYNTFA